MDNEIKKLLLVDIDDKELIPLIFVANVNPYRWGISRKTVEDLRRGTGHKLYADTWDKILKNACYDTLDGHTWALLIEDDKLYTIRDDFEKSA